MDVGRWTLFKNDNLKKKCASTGYTGLLIKLIGDVAPRGKNKKSKNKPQDGIATTM